MIYVFTFLGEFGVELFNWQGVVRKFVETIPPCDRIICCSRANLYPLYESADEFIDVSEARLFRTSRAFGYDALFPLSELFTWMASRETREKVTGRVTVRLPSGRRRTIAFDRILNWPFDRLLKMELKSYVRARSRILSRSADAEPYRFIFSSERTEINGCTFGHGRDDGRWDFYELLPLDNNRHRRIQPDLSVRGAIEERLGWDLSAPFVLCQARNRGRGTWQPSTYRIPKEGLIRELTGRVRVVLLSFHTGRWFDSFSRFEESESCSNYACGSFLEQACLIHFANQNLFFTEGDFGSHIYVPPFLGRDVLAVAPRTVYELGSTPIALWNRGVFRFGGQIIPLVAEEVLASEKETQRLADEIGYRVQADG